MGLFGDVQCARTNVPAAEARVPIGACSAHPERWWCLHHRAGAAAARALTSERMATKRPHRSGLALTVPARRVEDPDVRVRYGKILHEGEPPVNYPNRNHATTIPDAAALKRIA